MAQHAILRFEKRKVGPAGALEAHHERTKEQYAKGLSAVNRTCTLIIEYGRNGGNT